MTDPLDKIIPLLPQRYQTAIDRLSREERRNITELRLRQDHLPGFLCGDVEHPLPVRGAVDAEELRWILNAATEFSPYAVQEQLAGGFVNMPGGHRLGLCGTAVVENGQVVRIKDISSVCIRVAKQITGIADDLTAQLSGSALIVGPPGSGKTTMLRETVRLLSDRYDKRVCVVDERGEIAAMRFGSAQLQVGRRTDVLSNCPKERGIELCLRAMNPQWIAVDEITSFEDVQAIGRACYCGVKLLATAHAANIEELRLRPVYRSLLELGFFQQAFVMKSDRTGTLERIGG